MHFDLLASDQFELSLIISSSRIRTAVFAPVLHRSTIFYNKWKMTHLCCQYFIVIALQLLIFLKDQIYLQMSHILAKKGSVSSPRCITERKSSSNSGVVCNLWSLNNYYRHIKIYFVWKSANLEVERSMSIHRIYQTRQNLFTWIRLHRLPALPGSVLIANALCPFFLLHGSLTLYQTGKF